jgi:hypothetical protein
MTQMATENPAKVSWATIKKHGIRGKFLPNFVVVEELWNRPIEV